MPIIFVHGVNTRYDPASDPGVKDRDEYFKQFVLPYLGGKTPLSDPINPYWGKDAAKFPWDRGGVPRGDYEEFAFGDEDDEAIEPKTLDLVESIASAFEPASGDGQALLRMARESFPDAVDALWLVATADAAPEEARDLVACAGRVAQYVRENPGPDWLAEVETDEQLLDRILDLAATDEESEEESFGLGDKLRGAGRRIAAAFNAIAANVSHAKRRAKDRIRLAWRDPLDRSLVRFLGDVLVYFVQREKHREPIRDTVRSALRQGINDAAARGEPLVVVAHSMGGNIVYDLMSSTPELKIDTFVTVGSQVAVMEELKLFEKSDARIPSASTPKAPKPANIGRWINVFDPNDILGFALGKVFADVEDYRIDTGRLWAHGGYFRTPMFFERLRVRLASKP